MATSIAEFTWEASIRGTLAIDTGDPTAVYIGLRTILDPIPTIGTAGVITAVEPASAVIGAVCADALDVANTALTDLARNTPRTEFHVGQSDAHRGHCPAA